MAKKTVRLKRKGIGLEMKTFPGKISGNEYIVFRLRNGSFHVFVETEAKDAAIDCAGRRVKRYEHTHTHWRALWKSKE
jgi:hypothetical protein